MRRLQAGPKVVRIAIEPTGGYEKPLVKALRRAGFVVERVHTSRFKAYRDLVGAKAKSDPSDARLLAAYAASPDEVRGCKADRVEVPEDAVREALAELASRRDQLKRMIHAESCRLKTMQIADLRQSVIDHLEMLNAEDKRIHKMMLTMVRQHVDLQRNRRLLKTITGIGEKSTLSLIACVPELGLVHNKQAAALIGAAPFVTRAAP